MTRKVKMCAVLGKPGKREGAELIYRCPFESILSKGPRASANSCHQSVGHSLPWSVKIECATKVRV